MGQLFVREVAQGQKVIHLTTKKIPRPERIKLWLVTN